MSYDAFPLGSKPPSQRLETSAPTSSGEPQSSPEAFAEGGTTVPALEPHHQPQSPTLSKAEINNVKHVHQVFDHIWGFAGIRITSDLEYVSFDPSYDTRKHGSDVLNRIEGWVANPSMPLEPLVALLEGVASRVEEQHAQDLLETFRGKVDETIGHLSKIGYLAPDRELIERAQVLEANLPESLRIGKIEH
jgi:hypothetical protein